MVITLAFEARDLSSILSRTFLFFLAFFGKLTKIEILNVNNIFRRCVHGFSSMHTFF